MKETAKHFLQWPNSEKEKRGFVELKKNEWSNGLVEWVDEANDDTKSTTLAMNQSAPTSLINNLPFTQNQMLTNSFLLPMPIGEFEKKSKSMVSFSFSSINSK